jgi:hypothetical protein
MTINQIAVMTVNVVTGAPELDQGDTDASPRLPQTHLR